ncbi:MAG: sigma-54 dependent transcriptional regulator [Desulfobacteraceae bacterium]|nr:sigma-54 dependent transcriptional regulator [Desulfobacteraceae bacterium]MCF8037087.1 sigma-54 dependent transcriptional regulator [Desulfobacteraceae bacterium]
MKPQILIVDDDASHRRMLEAVLMAEGYDISHAADGAEAVAAVEKQFYDLVLLDIRMSRMGGIEALQEIKGINPAIPIIIMTAYASVGTAVEALKSGAYDYLTKPLDIDELKILVQKTLRHFQLETENRYLKERLDHRFDYDNIIGQGRAMTRMFETLSLAAPSDATVLILGESGTGKELVANAIHQNSPRKDRPFVKVNCAALPETLLESELFGHEKGAFTGALTRRPGRFRQADTGTIFLDEIAEMSQATQAKILRVLQGQAFEPLGSGQTVQVDIRVIAATNRVLEEAIEKGEFREDLYYRLNVVSVTIPPLRERREDLPLLADHFLKIYAEKNRRIIKGFSPRAMDLMMRYQWPGNVRELENAVERAVILARGEVVTLDELPQSIRALDTGAAEPAADGASVAGRSLKEMEKDMILRTLEQTGGNRTRAADILGISRRTLQLKLKKYDIDT